MCMHRDHSLVYYVFNPYHQGHNTYCTLYGCLVTFPRVLIVDFPLIVVELAKMPSTTLAREPSTILARKALTILA